MRVEIEHFTEKDGIFFGPTYFGVKLSIQFSEEEKQLIEENGLGEVCVIRRDISVMDLGKVSDNWDPNCYAKQLLKGPDTYFLIDKKNAIDYENNLKNNLLPQFKEYIMASAGDTSGSTFEL